MNTLINVYFDDFKVPHVFNNRVIYDYSIDYGLFLNFHDNNGNIIKEIEIAKDTQPKGLYVVNIEQAK